MVLAKAHTAVGGSPHAEAVAYKNITATGTTAYITLEPCSYRTEPHKGGVATKGEGWVETKGEESCTGSCVELLIAKKVKRVVIGSLDPNPRINGRGVAMLKKAGIKVDIMPALGGNPSIASPIPPIHPVYTIPPHWGFCHRHLKNRPWVTLKLALSKEGAMGIYRQRCQISNETATKFAHLLRSKSDAIAIGANTMEVDKPRLACLLYGDEASIRRYSPKPIVFTSSPNHSSKHPSSQTPQKPKGYSTLLEPTYLRGEDLREDLQLLASWGINRLLLEGGSQLAASFLREGLVNEAYLVKCSKALASSALREQSTPQRQSTKAQPTPKRQSTQVSSPNPSQNRSPEATKLVMPPPLPSAFTKQGSYKLGVSDLAPNHLTPLTKDNSVNNNPSQSNPANSKLTKDTAANATDVVEHYLWAK